MERTPLRRQVWAAPRLMCEHSHAALCFEKRVA
jgi:hypothetical protein